MNLRVIPAILLSLPVWAPLAQATELGRLEIAPGAYMVSACAGQRSGGGTTPGDKGGWYAGLHECNASQSPLAGGSVSGSASYAHPLVNHAVADGTASMGQLKLYASFDANNQIGVGAWATGGWVDMVTVNAVNPALQGTQAILTFSLHADGTLVGLPKGNSGVGIEIFPYINDSFIGIPEASYAGQNFKVSGQGQYGFPYNATVDDDAIFRAVVTLGTPFELGIFARATAGVAGVGPDWYSGGTVDFSHTIEWSGIQGVTVAGNAVDFTVDSLSGTPWIGAYVAPVPEAPTWVMMSLAGLLVGVFRRRLSRA